MIDSKSKLPSKLQSQEFEHISLNWENWKQYIDSWILDNFQVDLNQFESTLWQISGVFDNVNKKFFAEFDQEQRSILNNYKTLCDWQLERLNLIIWIAQKHNINLWELSQKYVRLSQKYVEMIGWIWDRYEWSAYVFEKDWNLIGAQSCLNLMPNILNWLDDKSLIRYVASLYIKVYENNFKSENVKKSYKQIMSGINQIVLQRFKSKFSQKTDSQQEIVQSCLDYSKLITWRLVLDWKKVDVDWEYKDPDFATNILMFLMNDNLKLVDELMVNWKIKLNDSLVSNQSPQSIVDDFAKIFQRKFGKWVDYSSYLDNIWFGDLKGLNLKDYNKLTFQQKIKISILKRFNNKLRNIDKPTFQQFADIFSVVWKEWFDVVSKSLDKNFEASMLDWNWKTSKDFWLKWIKAQIFDLYNDIHWNWLLKLSDKTMWYASQAWDVACVLWASILAWIAIWASLPVSVPALAWAAITWSVIWTVWTTASILTFKQWYDTKKDMIKDVWSDFVLNAWLWAVSWAVWAKYIKHWSKILSTDWARSAVVNIWDLSVGSAGEWARQQYILWNDLDFNQIFLTWMVVSWAWSVASKSFWKAMQHVDLFKTNVWTQVYDQDSLRRYADSIYDLSIWREISISDKQLLVEAISANYSYVWILRINKWDVLRNFSFSEIKSVNDHLGQNFTDKILDIVRDKVYSNLATMKIRKIRENYKNLTVTSSEKVGIEEFYEIATRGLKDISKIPEIRWIIEDWAFRQVVSWLESWGKIRFADIEIPKHWLDEFIKNNPEWWKRLKTMILSDARYSLKLSQIQEDISYQISKMNLLVWESVVEWSSPQDKLVAFFKAERAGVIAEVEWSRFWVFNESKVKQYIWDLEKIESDFLNYKNSVVTLPNWTKIKAVVEISLWDSNEYRINDILLRKVRKWEKIWDIHLESLIRDYLNKTKAITDCIKDWTFSTLRQDFEIAWKLDKLISRLLRSPAEIGQEDVDLLKYSLVTNQKWVLTKQAFNDLVSREKTWNLVFIDIKDMWIMNHNDFLFQLKSMLKQDWTIDYSKMLHSWDSVTNRFRKFVSTLKDSNPDLVLSLWWDEVKFWSKSDIDVWHIKSCLSMSWLNWRITHHKLDWSAKSASKLFESLDKSSWIIKLVEEKLSAMSWKSWSLLSDQNISFEIGNIDSMWLKLHEQDIKQYLWKHYLQFGNLVNDMIRYNTWTNIHIWANYYLRYDRSQWLVISHINPEFVMQSVPSNKKVLVPSTN